MRFFSAWISTVFYIGRLPLAPGTWASFFATLAWYFLFKNTNLFVLPIVSIGLFFLGIFVSNYMIKISKEHDPSYVVIDEWVGQWIAFTFLPVNLYTAIIGFVLFRIFDISKFGIIKKMEKLPGGWGIMMDDVVAGLFSSLCLYVMFFILSV